MARAQFSEKEYETAFAIELASRRGYVLSSSQVIEKIVGYDAAAHPAPDNLIWRLLNIPRPPGLRLVEPHWRPGRLPDPAQLPRHPVSLLMQYKRPDYLHGPQAKQWPLWNAPYYRFVRRRRQHAVLRRLQRRLGSQALVRYAAPAFWTRAEYEYRHIARSVIEGSGFVSPQRIGGHAVWTYQEPGRSGRPNPSGAALPFESFADLAQHFHSLSEGRQELVPYDDDPLRAHLETVGEAARWRNPTIRRKAEQWLKNAWAVDLPIENESLQQVADVASITTLMAQLNASWHVALSLELEV